MRGVVTLACEIPESTKASHSKLLYTELVWLPLV